jgi:hypothetical protein
MTHVRVSTSRLLRITVVTAMWAGCSVVSATADARPPGCAAFPRSSCSDRTAVAVFGQLSTTDPAFTGRATDYSQPRAFGISDESLNIVRIRFRQLGWRHWGSLRAVGRGFATTCATTSSGTHCGAQRVRLTADNFAPCGDINLYTRLRAYGVAGFSSPLSIPVGNQTCQAARHDARDAARAPLIQGVGGGRYKPASFCPANQTCFSNTRWVHWGATAVGHGTAHFDAPGAASRTFRTTITLSRVRQLCGGLRYTRAVWSRGKTYFIDFGGCGSWSGD